MIWNSLDDFFDFINNNTEYVILRNWEEYPTPNLLNGKDDIDILCSNKAEFVDAIGAIPLYHNYNICNYYVDIGNYRIRIDIRYIGDGYYCREWEERILKRRIFCEKGFYILNSEDYLYSLLYHGLIQKPKLSPVYYERLNAMADSGGQLRSEAEFLLMLHEYMERYHFYVEYPLDCAVFLNRKNIHTGKLSIRKSGKRKLFRIMYRVHIRVSKLCAKIIH